MEGSCFEWQNSNLLKPQKWPSKRHFEAALVRGYSSMLPILRAPGSSSLSWLQPTSQKLRTNGLGWTLRPHSWCSVWKELLQSLTIAIILSLFISRGKGVNWLVNLGICKTLTWFCRKRGLSANVSHSVSLAVNTLPLKGRLAPGLSLSNAEGQRQEAVVATPLNCILQEAAAIWAPFAYFTSVSSGRMVPFFGFVFCF